MGFMREFLLSNAKKIGPRRAKSIWQTLMYAQYYYLPTIIAMTIANAFIAVASYAVSFILPMPLIAPAIIYGAYWVTDIGRQVYNEYYRQRNFEINKFNNAMDHDIAINNRKRLYKLRFTDMQIDNDVAGKLAALLDANPDIMTLDLSGCKFTNPGYESEGFVALAESIIRRLDSLTVIDLSTAQNYNTEGYISTALEIIINPLTTALRDNNKLTHLRLPKISSTAALNVQPFVNSNRVLVELSIDEIFEDRNSSFQNPNTVQLITAINQNKKLQIINIPNLLISEETIADLEEILARPNLIKLSLHYWRASIDDTLKTRFIAALRRNTSLTNVVLNTNGRIRIPGGARDLYLEEADILLVTEALASDRITEINFSSYNHRAFTDETARRLADAINIMPNLAKFNLKYVLFSPAGLRIIGEALRQKRKLREITLEEVGIVHTPTGEEIITTFVTENSIMNNLTTVDLRGAPLAANGAGITQIANTIRERNSKLQTLGIGVTTNLMGDAYVAAINAATTLIADALIANKEYTSLDVVRTTGLNTGLLQPAINIVNDFRSQQSGTQWLYFATRAHAWSRFNNDRKRDGSETPVFASGKELPDLPVDLVKHIETFVGVYKRPLRLSS